MASDAPCVFKKGDRVALRRGDGSLDLEQSGIIVECLGADLYLVERDDGQQFRTGFPEPVEKIQ